MEVNPFVPIQSDLKEVKKLLLQIINKPKEDLSHKLYTIKEAAELLKVDKQTVKNYINKGTLKAKYFGRSIRIPYSQIFNSMNEVKSLKYKR
ncbi:helix-turn-helix domain-containing protein [Tenacibaculum finnmarkense]|uniref:helix-turn-helix domain-containing protein n=1 Tax=Tenacibaculum finnmarkense TaxID=2781243 RepID=UPI000C465CCA|nr:helix-turn-helix domain-containing protein [Tenacibaculum finnmarkense]MCD8405214.1 helix-turn-helix domain-containing protein [Tenacibaculum dicentrarchi]MCD8428680.1 helix-turn-helix domain-containing protein [Tenacibaculum finnmarkense genomovar ulcerans]MCD8439292.1 helix-turn-helix domain-containing protein [Tenacibaculum finnmarkense genomovar ulcerans]MCG8720140.1 helix-turn-helix domain-containing protein [Tenacibaculum finnmarkense]MCG8732473.1 helix-turn-helix domain-containing pr